jgi:threonine/homoserine/homoserine lactone efflux protein
MPDLNLIATFVLATVVLMCIPGPNVALIVANSVAHGVRFGLLTVTGTLCGVTPQLLLVGLGLAGLLDLAAHWFEWLRWAGVGYLVYLGVQAWRAPAADLAAVTAQPRSGWAIFAQGVLIALTNPKTLLFLGAFLPQFVVARAAAGPQVALLAGIYFGVALVVDSLWALLAARLRGWLRRHGRLRARLTGSLLIGAGAGLALARGR